MSPFGVVVIGKRETLSQPGLIASHEAPIDWPDQGTAEGNWALNSALLERVVAGGGVIRDADVVSGVLRADTGFLSREREQLRRSGRTLAHRGYWEGPHGRSLSDLALTLIGRARAAAAAGARTFAIPEAAPIAVWIAARVANARVRADAVAWLRDGAGYHELVRLAARAALALDPPTVAPIFRKKVADELEPMLSLWPHALVIPMTTLLSRADLIRLRAFPLHPLGLVHQRTWADGCFLAPSEYFFHDLDHARFKLREDLLSRGVTIPDAYRDGSTIDPRTGRHRSILPFARNHVASLPGQPLRLIAAQARTLLERVLELPHPDARAAELLLFEIVHEKSLPIDRATLARACSSDAHLLKLARKCDAGFFGVECPTPAVMAALPAARAALLEICR